PYPHPPTLPDALPLCHPANLAAPQASTVDDVLGTDRPVLRHDAGDAAFCLGDAGDPDTLENPDSALTGTLGERKRNVGRISLARSEEHTSALQSRENL